MTLNELRKYDGTDGAKAYVAYRGKVYDVTESPLWKGGEHEGVHRAGEDLTAVFAGAPHGEEVFARYPVVGTLEIPPAAPSEGAEERLRAWYRLFHPHPMTVHFPIALHLFAAGLDLLFLADPKAAYAVGVFYAFFVATVMGLAAMVPGILSWWINYDCSTARPFVVKLVVATLTLLLGLVGIVLYLEEPGIVYHASLPGIAYHAIVLVTGLNVIVLGYYGGKITWGDAPDEEEAALPERPAAPTRPVLREAAATLPAAGRYEAPQLFAPTAAPVRLASPVTPPVRKVSSMAILVGGAAGMGIDTLEKLLSDAFRRSGYYLFSTKEYMSRVRGGSNTTLIRIGDAPLEAPCWEVDLFVAIDAAALEHGKERCTDKTVIVADRSVAGTDPAVTAVPMAAEAQKLGHPRYANTYAAGVVFGLLGLEAGPLMQSVVERFGADTANKEAAATGMEAGAKLGRSALPPLPEPAPGAVGKLHLMDGTTAAGFGFLAGGCNFVASYPMSPSTGVLNFMAAMSKQLRIAVEQSEDEIASLHLVLGAWYAGARALTTTSGGGFALMGEALSLSGMTETPAVVYLAQRPGPATGLPTRSEQGDLNLALHSGHGPFPRVVLAPGSLRECIECGYLAFELADRYQLPVIVLSDQYLADTIEMTETVDFSAYEQRRYIVPTEEGYRRYADTASGISPRGVPAFGEGRVCAVSDEHDERGQITEDHRVRDKMVSKRARKAEGLVAEALPPLRSGEGNIAVVGWGSTRGAVAEALRRLNDPQLMQVHFFWMHPLNPEQLAFLKTCRHVIAVENNADGAFAERLRGYGIAVGRQILQSDGFSFFADTLAQRLGNILKELS